MTSKKILAIILALAMILSMAACSSGSNEPAQQPEQGGEETAETVRIGILQFAPHASLDNCYIGIIEGLKEAGFVDGETCTIDFVNGMGEGETNSMAAQKFVTDGCDVIIAIATPSATAAYAAAKDAGIPVIFSAVSSPTGAGLVKDLNAPQSGCSGTSDNLNYPAQMAMMRAFQPDAKTVGILYTTSEANSLAQLEEYQKIAGDYGFEIKAQGVTDASEIASGIASLLADGIDCLCNLTDNNVVNNFSVVTAATDPAGIPCYGSEEEQVAQYGCVGSETLDYVALGKTTGQMAADVLNGADIMTMAVSIVSDSEPV
ncbi:MAG: ABC transporter substrate-binding protein, partial [Firmicutes bacterium]|nr:ABC transporter substrate-binding protein [Bacillota bacterium]